MVRARAGSPRAARSTLFFRECRARGYSRTASPPRRPREGSAEEAVDYLATFKCIKMTGRAGSLGDGSMYGLAAVTHPVKWAVE